jgi:apolipoprotein N-acyltransferase
MPVNKPLSNIVAAVPHAPTSEQNKVPLLYKALFWLFVGLGLATVIWLSSRQIDTRAIPVWIFGVIVFSTFVIRRVQSLLFTRSAPKKHTTAESDSSSQEKARFASKPPKIDQ